MSRHVLAPALLVLLTTSAVALEAQERRRQPGGPPPATDPVHHRVPWAGAWQGMRHMDSGPGREGMAYAIVVEADSAGRPVAAMVVLPDGKRVAAQQVTHADGVLSWQQPNSGGGTWHYAARLVHPDRLQGTLVLKDWPQGRGTTPSGTFTLARRPPA